MEIVIFFIILILAIQVCCYYERRKPNPHTIITFPPELVSELMDLYDRLTSEGSKEFFIVGIGLPMADDGYNLKFKEDEWIVYFSERGNKNSPIFCSSDKEKAFKFFYDFIVKN